MDFVKWPDRIEGLRDRFMKCAVESGARPTSNTNLKGTRYMYMDGLPEETGHVAHQLGEQQQRRNCTRAAFSVISTTGARKLQRRGATFRHKLSDSGSRFWEELSIHPDGSVNSLADIKNQRPNSCVTHLRKELEEESPESFPMPAAWIPPSPGRHADIEMEPINDLQRASENFPVGLMTGLPQRPPRTSELPESVGAFTEGLGLVPDSSLFMDLEPSEFKRLSPSPVMAPLPQPLLAKPDGDVVMCDKPVTRKSKEIPILERVGETLRQKKLRATQA